MKISLLPKSRLGLWSGWLSIAVLIIGTIFYIFVEIQKAITSETLIAIVGITTVLTSLVSFIIGTIAIKKHKDYSILVFLSILIGLTTLLFIFGDMFFWAA